MVIWLLGISGAGKTTLGNKIKERLEAKKLPNYMIDGDKVRDFFDGDLGFSIPEREANIKRILLATHVLDQNDIITIVCNISPFERLRAQARKKIAGYNEIFLDKNIGISKSADVKNVYAENMGKTELVGIDFEFDTPENCDLRINVDAQSVEESLTEIMKYLNNKYSELGL